ncbi:MAG: proline dehydrogenase [Acidobacteria bacterium]|nr:MAG: proline dehydrogenase [Acidobacteriota bacterium]
MRRGRRALLRALMLVPRGLVWRFARTYIAGDTLEDGLAVARRLNEEGCRATLDVLGEGVRDERAVREYVDAYKRAIDGIVGSGVQANVSVKPTALGLALSSGLALEAVGEVLERAARDGLTVRLDMEDSSVTQKTLDLYRALRQRGHDNVGVVLQAYLRRTLDDVRRLASEGASVRICKGIYIEPREIAYQDDDVVRRSFVDAVRVMLDGDGTFTAVATHDEALVFETRRLLRERDIGPDRYEFQMLLGVDAELRRLIVAEGHPMRVYVPFGSGWYAYSLRRLVENPRLASHVARNVLGFGPGRSADAAAGG